MKRIIILFFIALLPISSLGQTPQQMTEKLSSAKCWKIGYSDCQEICRKVSDRSCRGKCEKAVEAKCKLEAEKAKSQ